MPCSGEHDESRVWELFVGNVERWRAGVPQLNEKAASELGS
ncbi:hypothetical protein ACI5FR_15195 [Paenibacillus sp. HJGM_3]